jgi:hypothetical protein
LLVVGSDRERAEHIISVVEVAALMVSVEGNEVSVAAVSLGIIKIEGEKDGILPGRIVLVPIKRQNLRVGRIALLFGYPERPEPTAPQIVSRGIQFA